MKNNENKGQINQTVVVFCGVLLGVVLMAFGVYCNVNSEYSKLNLPTAEKIQAEINAIYQELETSRKELLDEFNKNEYEWIENMCISKIYSYHTEIFDNIYEKYEKYRKSNINDMAKALNLDEEYIKNLIFWEFKIMKEKK